MAVQKPMEKPYWKYFVLFIFSNLFFTLVFAQKSGIRGSIKNEKGEPIPFASIGVEKMPAGTMANQEGIYQLDIQPGSYKIFFHCLGFQTQSQELEITKGYQDVNITLREQVLQMREITIAARNEDPAYGIMRKAIARAKINKMMVDAYKARIYVKGSGRILEMPFLIRGLAKKEGFDENTVFFTETLENLEFKQPNTYKEVVIAARSTAGNIKINQSYIKSDLYSPTYGSTISPFSPSAFGSYRFQYLGAFSDRNHEVFKIKVIPKIKGEKVWEGEINIIDNIWCIHSAHLESTVEGIDTKLDHTYAPQEGIWMPVQLAQDFRGKLMGVRFEAKYNASISQYKLTKNTKLYADYQALEQKLEEKTSEEFKKPAKEVDLKALEKEDKKLMKKMVKAYAKEKLKEKFGLKKKDPNAPPRSAHIQSNLEFSVDSNAYKKDSTFWDENRAVPLTEMEVKSYHKLDSIRVKEEKEDSTKVKKKKGELFSLTDVILGKTYLLGKKDSLGNRPLALKYFSPLTDFTYNAIEGYAGQMSVWTKVALRERRNRVFDDRPYLQIGPTLRYSFGRQKWLGFGTLQFGNPFMEWQLEGGTRMRQMNPSNSVSPNLNSMYAYLGTRNFMKLYEEDFVELRAIRKLTGRLEVESSLGWYNRIPVRNSQLQGAWGKDKSFYSNEIDMPFAPNATLKRTVAFSWQGRLDWFPVLESSIYNGRQNFYSSESPRLRLEWDQAIPGVAQSTMDFTRLSFSFLQDWKVSEQGNLGLFGKVSGLVRGGQYGQMDVAQVRGNRFHILSGNPLESFRNLDYYNWSSQKGTFELHAELTHKRLFLGWLSRKKTWQEVLIANGMANPDQPWFYELGYGIDQLFRFMRIEVIRSQWQDIRPEWSFRLGLIYRYSIQPGTFNRRVEEGFKF